MNDIKKLKEKDLEMVNGGASHTIDSLVEKTEPILIQDNRCKCDICNATFSDASALIQHKASAHNSHGANIAK